MHRDLIYDVGIREGEDTALYLAQGYRVVAIEPDPTLLEAAQKRFRTQLNDGSLRLLPIALAETEGTAQIRVHAGSPDEMRGDRQAKNGEAGNWKTFSVAAQRFEHVCAENGIPYFVNINVPEQSTLCLRQLNRQQLPCYASIEAGEPVANRGIESLHLLHESGYRRFKLLNSRRSAPLELPLRRPSGGLFTPRQWQLFKSRLLSKVDLRNASRVRATTLAGSLLRYPFRQGAPGIWGEDIPGDWMSFDEAAGCYLYHLQEADAKSKPASTLFRWHAKA